MKHIQTFHPSLRALSETQIAAIHEASLQILETTGIEISDEEARSLLLDNGAYIGSRGRVHIPAHMIQDALASAPKRIPVYNQRGELSMPLVQGEVYFGPGSDTIHTIDVETGERRHAAGKDIRDIARLCDSLENIDFVMTMGTIWDVPNADMYIHGFIEVIRGTDKPMVFTANDLRDIRHIWRIACAVAGGPEEFRQRPFLINYSEPISPLLFADDSVQKMLFCAEVGIPMAYIPSPNMGGGGTVTMAGALALGNAETLAGMLLTQLKRRGAPFLYGANVAVMDMRTMVVCYGSPEWSLSDIALADMARYYGLPVWGTGGATDSKVIDTQAGLEAMMSIYTAYLARLTLIHDVGYIESGLTSAMEMIVLGNEIIGMVRHVVEGVRVDAETLALDAIHNVVPGSGFMADEHTLNNWRSALYMPDLLDRQRYDRWEKKGSLDMASRLNRRAREILDSSEQKQLSEAVVAEIAAVLEERTE